MNIPKKIVEIIWIHINSKTDTDSSDVVKTKRQVRLCSPCKKYLHDYMIIFA